MDSKNKLPFKLKAKKRGSSDKNNSLRKRGFIPAVVYGQKIPNFNIAIDYKSGYDVFQQTGENTLIDLEIEGEKNSFPVLIHDFQKDPLSGNLVHLDFYKPDLEKKVVVSVPLNFVGQSRAVKDKGGTLVKNIFELEVKALPLNLPHEIAVDISQLEEFGDEIFVKDLRLAEGVEALKDPEDIIVSVVEPTKIEEELEKPIEENIEEVETVGKKEEEKEEEGAEKEEGEDK